MAMARLTRPVEALILGNGAAGAENQCLGLVEQLSRQLPVTLNVTMVRVGISPVARLLPPAVHNAVGEFMGAVGQRLAVSWPTVFSAEDELRWHCWGYDRGDVARMATQLRILERRQHLGVANDSSGGCGAIQPLLTIGSGRTTAALNCALRRWHCRALRRCKTSRSPSPFPRTCSVQIQHPRLPPGRLDLIVTPLHDCPDTTRQVLAALDPNFDTRTMQCTLHRIRRPNEHANALKNWALPIRSEHEPGVLFTLGSLHRVCADRMSWLRSAYQASLRGDCAMRSTQSSRRRTCPDTTATTRSDVCEEEGHRYDQILGKSVLDATDDLLWMHHIAQEIAGGATSLQTDTIVVVALIGGDLNAISARIFARCMREACAEHNSVLLVSTSRRTSRGTACALRDGLHGCSKTFYFDFGHTFAHGSFEPTASPYLAMLALADVAVVSADSVSMVSEAASAVPSVFLLGCEGAFARGKGKPLHTTTLVRRCRPKVARFQHLVQALLRVRCLPTHAPGITATVKEAIAERRDMQSRKGGFEQYAEDEPASSVIEDLLLRDTERVAGVLKSELELIATEQRDINKPRCPV